MYKKVIAAVLAASIGLGSGSASAMLPSGGFGFPGGNGGSGGPEKPCYFVFRGSDGPGTPTHFKLKWNTNINLASRIRDIILEDETHAIDASEFMEIALKEHLENSTNENIRNGCPGMPLTQKLINNVRNELLAIIRHIGKVRLENLFLLVNQLEQGEFDLKEIFNMGTTSEVQLFLLIKPVQNLVDYISAYCGLEESLMTSNNGNVQSLVRLYKEIFSYIKTVEEKLNTFLDVD